MGDLVAPLKGIEFSISKIPYPEKDEAILINFDEGKLDLEMLAEVHKAVQEKFPDNIVLTYPKDLDLSTIPISLVKYIVGENHEQESTSS